MTSLMPRPRPPDHGGGMAVEASRLLLPALRGCLSPLANERAPAEAYLASAEASNPASYLAGLLTVAASPDAEPEVRTLAALTLKNCLPRVWRPKRSKANATALLDEDKAQIRAMLLSAACEHSQAGVILPHTTQLALALAKVARFDFPTSWPTLFHELAAAAGLSDAATNGPPPTRAYLCVHHVLSELATKRLASDRAAYANACALLWGAAWAQWCRDMQMVIAHVDAWTETNAPDVPDAGAMRPVWERWRLGLKMARRLLLRGGGDGDGDFSENNDTSSDACRIADAAPVLLSALEALVVRRAAWRARLVGHHNALVHPLAVVLAWGPKKLLQTLEEVQTAYPYSSRRTVPGVLRACFAIAVSDDCAVADGGARIASLAMAYAKEAATCSAYFSSAAWQVPPTDDSAPTCLLLGSGEASGAFHPFSVATIAELVPALIRRHMALQADDATSWAEHAEGYHHEQMSGGAGGSAAAADAQKCRAGAEYLLLALVTLHRDWAASKALGAACGMTNHVARMLAGELATARSALASDAMFAAEGAPTEACVRLEAACAAGGGRRRGGGGALRDVEPLPAAADRGGGASGEPR